MTEPESDQISPFALLERWKASRTTSDRTAAPETASLDTTVLAATSPDPTIPEVLSETGDGNVVKAEQESDTPYGSENYDDPYDPESLKETSASEQQTEPLQEPPTELASSSVLATKIGVLPGSANIVLNDGTAQPKHEEVASDLDAGNTDTSPYSTVLAKSEVKKTIADASDKVALEEVCAEGQSEAYFIDPKPFSQADLKDIKIQKISKAVSPVVKAVPLVIKQYRVVDEASSTNLDHLPDGSELFVGNLPSNYKDKAELSDIFVKYGDIHEIRFKEMTRTVHGFIRYNNTESCKDAISAEDRREMPGGYKLDLQDSFKRNQTSSGPRSPGPRPSKPPSIRRNNNVDNDRRAPIVNRRNIVDRERSDDRDMKRRRGSTPPPQSNNDRRDQIAQNNRRREPAMAQIIVLGDLNQSFVGHVEDRCYDMRVTYDTMFLSPHQNLEQTVAQAKASGVLGIIFLERSREASNSVALQICTMTGSPLEYDKLSLDEACGFILRERDSRNQPQAPANNSNALATMIATLVAQSQAQNIPIDPNILLQLASAAAQPQSYSYGQPQQPNISSIMSMLGSQTSQQPNQSYASMPYPPAAQQQYQSAPSYPPQTPYNQQYNQQQSSSQQQYPSQQQHSSQQQHPSQQQNIGLQQHQAQQQQSIGQQQHPSQNQNIGQQQHQAQQQQYQQPPFYPNQNAQYSNDNGNVANMLSQLNANASMLDNIRQTKPR